MDYFADFGLLALSIGTIAVTTEAVTEVIKRIVKPFYAPTEIQITAISMLLAIFFAISMSVSLFDEAAAPVAIFFFGKILAGAIASRGSNGAHEILDLLRKKKS